MLTLFLALALQDLPADAKQVMEKADAKIEQLRKAFEETCAKIKAQEIKDLQKVHDSIKKGDPAGATAVKAKIDSLTAEVNLVVKGKAPVEQWLQGKWIMAGVVDKNFGEVWEFKGQEVIGSGIGDRVKGKILIDEGKIQIIWDSNLVEFLRIPEVFGDEATGVCRTGEMKAKRKK